MLFCRVFWQNDSAGINQRPDFYDTIARKVHVYRRNISHFSDDSLTLAPRAGSEDKALTIPLDAIVYCTGWSAGSSFLTHDQASSLGLPVPLQNVDVAKVSAWKDLDSAADSAVTRKFPLLKHPPMYRQSTPSHTPFRLYKAMAPTSDVEDHSIIFLGKMVVGNNFRVAEVQALWAVSYLDGLIKYEPEDMNLDIAKTVAWCRRRYLNKGHLGSYFFFDVIEYTDMLLAQLGLSSHKRKSWFSKWFGTCGPSDFRGLLDEYKALHSL